jgi:hypothetical protein
VQMTHALRIQAKMKAQPRSSPLCLASGAMMHGRAVAVDTSKGRLAVWQASHA